MRQQKGTGAAATARNKPQADRGTAAVKARRRASPELAAAIQELAGERGRPSGPTLAEVRSALQSGVTLSPEGELLFPQDRTALVIELDELIETHGMRARAEDFLAGART